MEVPKTKLTLREKMGMQLFIGSIIFVGISVIVSLVLEASGPMMAITFAAVLFLLLPVLAINRIRKRPPIPQDFFLNPEKGKRIVKNFVNSIRALGLIFGLLMLLFTVGGALSAYEIYEPDIPGGILIAFSGLLALGAAAFFNLEFDPKLAASNLPPPPQPSHIHETEIIREKEVIVKIRCQYCGNTFDEKLDQCSVCGAKK